MLTLKDISRDELQMMLYFHGEQSKEWTTVHPSGLICPRYIYFKLKRPEYEQPELMMPLSHLSFIGTVLHEKILPMFAERFKRSGFDVEVEKEVTGEIDGVKFSGKIDLLLTNPMSEQKVVIDLKFLHPNAIYKIFPHHINQVAAYAYITNAQFAKLYYIARDLSNLVVHDIDADTIQKAIDEIRLLIKPVKDNVDENQLPPPLSPTSYPCTYATAQFVAKCPFFVTCHQSYIERRNSPSSDTADIQQLAHDYIQLLDEINELEETIKPLKAQADEIAKWLKSLLKSGEIVQTEIGTVRLIETKQERIDTSAVRKLLQSLNLHVPTQTVIARRLEVIR